ncbi:hypothetical protein TPA0907_59610 [Micromonospora humidisoli]|nr:hypothetical protein TPA0907_59610 [Micromonospora sp. AKA109]
MASKCVARPRRRAYRDPRKANQSNREHAMTSPQLTSAWSTLPVDGDRAEHPRDGEPD